MLPKPTSHRPGTTQSPAHIAVAYHDSASDYMGIICAATGYFNFQVTVFLKKKISLCKSLKE